MNLHDTCLYKVLTESTAYDDATRSNALEEFLYSAVRKLLIPQLQTSCKDVVSSGHTGSSHSLPLQRSVSVENVRPSNTTRSTDDRARLFSDSDVMYGDDWSAAVGSQRAHSCDDRSRQSRRREEEAGSCAENTAHFPYDVDSSGCVNHERYRHAIQPSKLAKHSVKTSPNQYLPLGAAFDSTAINTERDVGCKTSEIRAGRREATEHSEEVEDDSHKMRSIRTATEHTDTSHSPCTPQQPPAEHLPPVTQSSRRRRRRSSAKNYGIDPTYMLTTPNGREEGVGGDVEECPLDSLDLEHNNWTECIEHCLRSNERSHMREASKPEVTSASSWADEMERVGSRDDAALQAKYSAICSRVFSPPHSSLKGFF